jgi:hypothetical protein
MTPLAQTLYAVALFAALLCLYLWTKRRRRVSQMVKRAVTGLSRETEG